MKYSVLATTLFSLSLFGSSEIEPIEAPNSKVKEDDSTKTAFEPLNQDDVGEAVANDKKNNAFWIAGLSITGLVSVIAAIISSRLKSIEKDIEIKKRAVWDKHYLSCEKFPDFKQFIFNQIDEENYYIQYKTCSRDIMKKDGHGEPTYGNDSSTASTNIFNFIKKMIPESSCSKESTAAKLKTALKKYLNEQASFSESSKHRESKSTRTFHTINIEIQYLISNFVYEIVSLGDKSLKSSSFQSYILGLHNLYLELEKANKIDAQKCYENELAQLNKECEAEKAKVWSLSFSSKKSVKYE